jgi:integrase/recombinase XerD
MLLEDGFAKTGGTGTWKNARLHMQHASAFVATHLPERGTDLRYIQTLLGHESSRTTGRYAHVTKRGFDKLFSPLDHIGEDFNLGGNKGI